MSILIKGIEKPEYGYIEIRLYDNRAEGEFQEHVYTDLEIEEVPESHGRLIDADKVTKKMEKNAIEAWQMNLSDKVEHTLNMSIDIIKGAPTVIEAEK